MKVLPLAIIGGGPAGITAAIYAKRANLNPIIFTDQIVCGKVAKTLLIENFPGFQITSGPDLCKRLAEQVARLKIEVVYQRVQTIDLDKQGLFMIDTGQEKFAFEKVVLASGTKERKLPAKGVDQFEGKGISYCSSCDGYFFKDQTIAVIGGGNSALEETKVLANIGKEIIILVRDQKIQADALLLQEIEKLSNVTIKYNTVLLEAKGKEELEQLVVLNRKDNTQENMDVNGLFIYIGSLPNTQFLHSDWKILDKNGYVITNQHFETKIKNFYAVGDVVSGNIQQYTTAMGSATTAFKDILEKGFFYSKT